MCAQPVPSSVHVPVPYRAFDRSHRVPAQLHTMAAYFPEQPSTTESDAMLGFIRSLSQLYPCRHCAADFRVGLGENPPRHARPPRLGCLERPVHCSALAACHAHAEHSAELKNSRMRRPMICAPPRSIEGCAADRYYAFVTCVQGRLSDRAERLVV